MKAFIGSKIVQAEPQERDNKPGYLVRYADGYVSWSPKAVFDEAYREIGILEAAIVPRSQAEAPAVEEADACTFTATACGPFGFALNMLRHGCKVARDGWNGKGMFLYLVPSSEFVVNRPPLLGIYPEGTKVHYRAHIDMVTADGSCVPWLASQTDLLAEDWYIVE